MHDLVKVDRMMIDSEHQKYYAVFRSNGFTNMKYSSVLAYWLKEEGYTTCFFVAGGAIMHLLDGFRTVFKCIPVVHEHSAGVCAEHYNECRKATGKAFALVTTGPGLTNIITAIAGCYVEHRELLVIAGQVKSSDLLVYPQRQNGVQEIDGKNLVRTITVQSECLAKPINKNHFVSLVRRARLPHPGPIMIEVCLDVQGMDVDEEKLNENIEHNFAKPAENFDKKFKYLREMMTSSQRPLWLLGGLATRKAVREILPILERLGIPCATTTSALDRIPNNSPIYVGRTGTWGGQRAANLILGQADLVIAVGAQLDLQQTGFNPEKFCPQAKLVKIFPSETELSKNGLKAHLTIPYNPDTFLYEEINLVEWSDEIGWNNYKNELLRAFPALEKENLADSEFINSFTFIENLSLACEQSDILALCSSGGTFTGSLQMLEIKPNQTATTSAAYASMGYGLATAIGAAFGCPGARVIATEGDGGFVQNMQELSLLRKHNLNIKLFIFENSGYASIRATQKKFFNGAYLGCDADTGLAFPNWDYLFKAYDIPIEHLKKGCETVNYLKKALDSFEGPQAFIVKVDPNQNNWPAVSTKLCSDGRLHSAPLYSMLPEVPKQLLDRYGKYLPND